MKKTRTLLFSICVLLIFGIVAAALLPKNTPGFAHFFNKNSIELEVQEGLDPNKVKVELTIWGTAYKDVPIIENGSKNLIPKDYGENDWYLSYGEKAFGVFRHFKTNNWHDHHYKLYFYEEEGQISCDVEIQGPDHLKNLTVKLNKKAKTPIHS